MHKWRYKVYINSDGPSKQQKTAHRLHKPMHQTKHEATATLTGSQHLTLTDKLTESKRHTGNWHRPVVITRFILCSLLMAFRKFTVWVIEETKHCGLVYVSVSADCTLLDQQLLIRANLVQVCRLCTRSSGHCRLRQKAAETEPNTVKMVCNWSAVQIPVLHFTKLQLSLNTFPPLNMAPPFKYTDSTMLLVSVLSFRLDSLYNLSFLVSVVMQLKLTPV